MVAEDAPHVFAIERFISQKIPRVKLENFDYRYTALFEESQARRGPAASPAKCAAVASTAATISRPADGDGKFLQRNSRSGVHSIV